MLEQYGHGGDLTTAETLYGRPAGGFLDFSSNMNPFGPPDAVGRLLAERWRELARYPDPAVRGLRRAIAAAYGIPEESVLVGNGAAELIDLSVRVLAPRSVALARPSFSEYEEAVRKIGGDVVDVPLSAEDGFALREETLREAAARADLLVLGHPNNPTGRLADRELLLRLVRDNVRLVVDEAFVDFVPDEGRVSLIRHAAETDGLYVIRSMTKFYAVPGVRLGFMVARPEAIRKLAELQVPWSVNAIAQWIGQAAFGETAYADRTRLWLAEERPWLTERLLELGLRVFESDVNFLLVSIPASIGLDVKTLQRRMGEAGVLIRDASLFPGLDESYFRLAIRLRAENETMLAKLRQAMTGEVRSAKAPEEGTDAGVRDHSGNAADSEDAAPALAPTIMFQGTSSDAGKSILTTALCRILLQDGRRVAPFKSQNMSLNSYVTPDGKEIGRAQGMQADACRIAATTDMNPILLKPKKDMVSQVVVHGKPLRDYDARSYRETYLGEAEQIVKDALARLRSRYDVVVIEGAGSPAEINLKDRDIVNMRLAGWADAPVVLIADIDRGGVFASLVGTLDILTPEERDRVKGFVINKFRGDVSLLKPGLDWLERRTGKPVLGVIPYLPELGLEDEDSASLDAKKGTGAPKRDGQVDIAILRLPRLSNFTDFDPLFEEPDVHARYVSSLSEWGEPDAVIIPGSKNTVDDLTYLRSTGLEASVRRYVAGGGRLLGICAGYQMLGRRLLDPDRIESDTEELPGIGLFPSVTTFTPDKRTELVTGVAEWPEVGTLAVEGYEIHMGRTTFVEPVARPFSIRVHDAPDEPASYHEDGAVSPDGKVWGTYMHGILHNDGLRRAWINRIRADKGWAPLPGELKFRSRREAAFDRLADHVRSHLDMERIYVMINGDNERGRDA
ncbi:cobyric acid synthase [Paenibacillus flagellatus]|uniref:Cobyric acid synthase n=1 Tax=Paenibacillus flagellatus TaxID=2211139 RepID=A0A2V5KCY4_9BACL|nr:cobyric acid synthase [Paenibacillus flagellatus]PYI57505.1 threonine-phosphate decarboxylase [Paenibacillus flagellatus]